MIAGCRSEVNTSDSTGSNLWKEESKEWSKGQQVVVADGLLFALTRNDELVMAEASRKGYKELGRVPLGIHMGSRPQQPTIANGRMYIRGTTSVICYRITE